VGTPHYTSQISDSSLSAYLRQLFPINNELANNTQQRMNIVIGTSIGAATLTYEIIAIFGYLTFGSNVGYSLTFTSCESDYR
jgi:hypothetical protein